MYVTFTTSNNLQVCMSLKIIYITIIKSENVFHLYWSALPVDYIDQHIPACKCQMSVLASHTEGFDHLNGSIYGHSIELSKVKVVIN